jgi:N-carbamoylputrescine amidase
MAHHKYYLPDEEGFWEASWYHRGDRRFTPIESGDMRLGFLICSELWFMEHARAYGKAGVNLIVTPRATEKATVDKWLVGGRTAAVVSGAFSLSSNRASSDGHLTNFGGQGWVIGPDGEVLGLTSREQPFVTIDIDLHQAEQAKQTYPRYIPE